MAGKNGGARPGSGRKPGVKLPATLAKEAARDAYRAYMAQHMDAIMGAQVRQAMGLFHLMLRDPDTGQFTRIESSGDDAVDKATIDAAVSLGKSRVWISTKDPNQQALTDILNRYLDKPAEQEQTVNVKGVPELLARLDAGRLRNAK